MDNFYGDLSSSEDDDFSINGSSDDSDATIGSEDDEANTSRTTIDAVQKVELPKDSINIMQKLLNRECTFFSGKTKQRCAFNKVPNRLGFCLKDIVPRCFLQGHLFMGLSACGQFLLSYKVSCNENALVNQYYYNINYVYTLYFWEYQPHKPLQTFYKCCLFDDHGVDNLKQVTMTQWKCSDPRILIIHGAAENENEDSYITYVKVPKLGCLECKKLREDEEGIFRSSYTLCLKCNLTIHTKYSSTESDQEFNAYVNLICPERILIVANGFMHMLRIDVETSTATAAATNNHYNANNSNLSQLTTLCHMATTNTTTTAATTNATQVVATNSNERRLVQHATTEEVLIGCDNHNNIVARIIADFSDIESSDSQSNAHNNLRNNNNNNSNDGSANETNVKTYDELIFTCNGSTTSNNVAISSTSNGAGNTGNGKGSVPTKTNLISHRGQRRHRIVTKSYRNGVTTVDVQNSSLVVTPSCSNAVNAATASTTSTTATTTTDKSNAYEFSEDNEKCEKISTLRKRRLADKKYEFSEDNSENIVPFTKLRATAGRSGNSVPLVTALFNSPTTSAFPVSSPCPSSPSSSSSPHPSTTSTPPLSFLQLGFSSPPYNPPVGGGIITGNSVVMRSPSRQIYNVQNSPSHSVPLTNLQVSMAKRNHMEVNGSMSPNANMLFSSPRREDYRVVEVPLQDGVISEKPVCTKKLKRRYVEEDDAASVITSEEDDCISPGYHTSLPMEVHGSCYSELQMISQASYQQLRCPSVVITQHSFDLETFTYYVISTLCHKNNKIYDVFYDWACELISVCPLSHTIMCLLMAQFSANDQLPVSATYCLNCSRKFSCAIHRGQFECRILFTWNMESGEWEVLDYGEMNECKFPDLVTQIKRVGNNAFINLAQRAKKLAAELASAVNKVQDYSKNLRVLDSNVKKSKRILSDLDNMIEFYLKRPNIPE